MIQGASRPEDDAAALPGADAGATPVDPGQHPDRLAGIRFDPRDGLVTAVVQDAADGRVLMLAHMDAEALEATIRTGEVHFHSRSRGRLWRKGETSGNVLHLRAIEPDCDGDALLLSVHPAGPTCHRGSRSCFDPAEGSAPAGVEARPSAADPGFAWLGSLWATVRERAASRPEGSYTTALLDGGVDAVGRKVTEEATEVLLAAKDDATAQAGGQDRTHTRQALAGEAADLLYHLLVLLEERGLSPAEVIDVLRERHRP